MKKIVKRRRFLRINNPLAFGVLCALVVLAVGGAAYGLGAGVIAPVVKTIKTANAQQAALAAADVTKAASVSAPDESAETAAPGDTAEPTAEPEATPEPSAEPEATPEPEPTETPEPVSGEDQGPVGSSGRLSGHTIAIDAAKSKGGKYKGYSTKTPEHEINLKMALAVKEALEAEGATVIMTRTSVDDKPDDSGRAKIINGSEAELTVSLMCNTVSSHDIRGTQVIVSTKKDTSECKKLGKAVLNSYKDYTDMPLRDGDGIRTSSSWKTINALKKPACLLILGHISNKTDDNNLADDGFVNRGAQGIVNGILSFLGK